MSLMGIASPSSQTMVDNGWSPSKVTQAHLQDLVSQGFMMEVEHVFCRVPEDPVSPMPMEGYMVVCAAFYERGFGVPSH
jgi:hypothetical protein